MSQEKLRENLIKFRHKKGLSREALASICKVGRTTIIDIESGKTVNPTYKTVCRLAMGLGVTYGVLVGKEECSGKDVEELLISTLNNENLTYKGIKLTKEIRESLKDSIIPLLKDAIKKYKDIE